MLENQKDVIGKINRARYKTNFSIYAMLFC